MAHGIPKWAIAVGILLIVVGGFALFVAIGIATDGISAALTIAGAVVLMIGGFIYEMLPTDTRKKKDEDAS